MGCQNSKAGTKEEVEKDKELGDFVSAEEIEVIRSSWETVKQDIPGTGIYMFTRLFELQSDFKKFFKRLMTQTETGEYDFDWNKLSNHANIVMNALDNAVDSIQDSSYLSKGLQELGERHKMYSIKPEMVPLMWPAIRDALRQALAEEFTVETELAWKHVFDYIVFKMSQGMKRPDKTASSSSSPDPQNANGVPS
ncbi:neuroglobin-like [Babylonia areolata]|uniref:neuroglobin-like n=1 Tax=Babylonia areolata TaxID=304850 RepID=UPI003FD539DF